MPEETKRERFLKTLIVSAVASAVAAAVTTVAYGIVEEAKRRLNEMVEDVEG
jgi:hypothetical protein